MVSLASLMVSPIPSAFLDDWCAWLFSVQALATYMHTYCVWQRSVSSALGNPLYITTVRGVSLQLRKGAYPQSCPYIY